MKGFIEYFALGCSRLMAHEEAKHVSHFWITFIEQDYRTLRHQVFLSGKVLHVFQFWLKRIL